MSQCYSRSFSFSLEQRPDADDFGDAFGQFPGDSLHERHHALFSVVMPGNDPNHTNGVHHRRNRLNHHVEVTAKSQVLPERTQKKGRRERGKDMTTRRSEEGKEAGIKVKETKIRKKK